MLDEDSDEEMDTVVSSQPPPAGEDLPTGSGGLQSSNSSFQPASSLPPSTRSGSASPYADDESFAMFVAQEANDTASVLEQDISSLSPSPIPTPSSNDLLPSSSYEGAVNISGESVMVQQFGITASCPSTPLQLSMEAKAAVSSHSIVSQALHSTHKIN